MPSDLRVFGVPDLPEVEAGADIGALIAASGLIEPRDVVVVAQKIVSKAEGRVIAAETREDARAAAKRDARRIVRETEKHLITETHHGFVCANSGVDMSNVAAGTAVLLPKDPDRSARRIRATLEERIGRPIAVIVSDTFGRAWRIGHVNVAIGSSGIRALRTYEGQLDPAGRELLITQIAQIDELAAATELVMDKLARIPVAVVRGYDWQVDEESTGQDIVRPPEIDLFR
jgi:coenzyme F420-0:L-glutamate ligase / coenzyme F420-1:gamma-L-glutamate ligase